MGQALTLRRPIRSSARSAPPATVAGVRCLVSLIVLSLLAACSPLRPQVTLEPGVSLRAYRVVVVGPVTDLTGYPFQYNVGDSLRAELADRLRNDGIAVAPDTTDTTVPVLFVVSSLDGFKSGALAMRLPTAMGTSRCAFSSRLMDGHSGRRLGEIVSAEVSSDDTPQRSPAGLLATCARMTADELARRLKR
jgi:hypothetical protein